MGIGSKGNQGIKFSTPFDQLQRVQVIVRVYLNCNSVFGGTSDEFTDIKGGNIAKVDLYATNKAYKASYIYDQLEGAYLRSSEPNVIEKSKELFVPNIIIQYVNTEVIDEVGRLNIQLSGKGEAIFLRAGKMTKGSWQKEFGVATKYYDEQGKLIKLVKGPIWIHLIDKKMKVEYSS